MSDATLSEWARLLFGTLARLGVSDVVVSPGSRSTPFAWAALHTAGLCCHSIWDERSAAFFAVGQARVTARPSVLLCTSGSAAAQYFPAVVEASQSELPLLVLSADRPFELMDCGAAQAMDQTRLYGDFARHYFELGHPERDGLALDGLVRKLAQAVAGSLGPRPGPVQLNARARKPLEPVPPKSDADRALAIAVSERLERGPTQLFAAASAIPSLALDALAAACRAARSGLIVCGPLASSTRDVSALFELARATGFPLCLETTSQARRRLPAPVPEDLVVLGGFDALLASRLAHAASPELVLTFGAPPTSGSFERWRGTGTTAHAVITAHGWLDPSNRARWLVNTDPLAFASALSSRLGQQPERVRSAERKAFAAVWRQAERLHWQVVEQVLAEPASGGLSEPLAVRIAIEALPDGGLLGVGNSLPIRSADAFAPPRAGSTRVWSQRGVNGIDGLVSGAVGAAQAAAAPSLALLGDVSLMHDVGGLAAARTLTTPLCLLVLDNAGGRIFDELPMQAALAAEPSLGRFWLTPPNADFSHAAGLFQLPYRPVEDAAALRAALEGAFAHPGCTLIHARVAADSVRRARERIRAGLDAALDRELG